MQYKKNIAAIFPGVFKLLGSEEKGKHSNATMFVVYMYLAHQFCSTEKNCVRLSYDDISKGTLVDRGTGLSKGAIARALKSLLVLKLTEEKRSELPAGGGIPPMTVIRYKVFCPTLGEKGELLVKHFVSPNDDFARPENRPGLINDRPLPGPLNDSIPSLRSVIKPETKVGEVLLNSTSIEVTNKHKQYYPLLNNHSTNDNNTSILTLDLSQELTLLLWNSLGPKNRKVKSTQVGWKAQFTNNLKKMSDTEVTRLRKALKWYSENTHRIGEDYFPVAICPNTFVDKLSSIEAKMNSSKRKPDPADRTWHDQGPASFEEPELTEETEELHNRSMADKI